jgi:hypothetical protein
MTAPQLQLFAVGSRLADASLEQRLAVLDVMIDEEPMTLPEREQLLLLALAPKGWGAEQ